MLIQSANYAEIYMAESKITKNEYRKLLWENPHAGSWSPSTHGDIILSSDNYDYLEFEMRITGGNPVQHVKSVGNVTSSFSIVLSSVDTSAIGNNFMMGRNFLYVSRTRFTPSTGIIARWGASGVEINDTFAVPVKIYGIKY